MHVHYIVSFKMKHFLMDHLILVLLRVKNKNDITIPFSD